MVSNSRRLVPGEGILIGEISTNSDLFEHQEIGHNYQVTYRASHFITREVGKKRGLQRLYSQGDGLGAASVSATLNSSQEKTIGGT